MILPKMLSFMEKYHMLEECGTLVLGVSGGADSVCLLLVMEKICRERGIAPVVVHIEHGIRGKESLEDAAFVENLCRKKSIPFYLFSYPVEEIAKQTGESTEEAGRRLRYAAFDEVAAKYKEAKIAVAHNENDQAETVLFHLVRGSGLKGMGGIPPVRGNIIRPLLCISRAEIEAYLKEAGQPYCTDSTNASDVYARNRIRHTALPSLMEVNAKAVAHIGQTAAEMAEAAAYIEAQAAEAAVHCVECGGMEQGDGEAKEQDCMRLKEAELLTCPPFLQRQILYQVIGAFSGSRKDITREHVVSVLGLFQKQVGRRVSLPGGCVARRDYGGICIERQTEPEKMIPVTEEAFSFRIFLNNPKIGEIPKNQYTKWFDYDKIEHGTQIRTRQEGDFFVLDEKGGKKKLKSYFIDEKIQSEERDRIPLLADGSHILWIVGYRISAYYKVTKDTRRILEVRYDGGMKR